MDRFAEEAQALAALNHPAIVRSIASGKIEGDRLFLALEWLDGESLADRIGRGNLTLAQALSLGARVGEALGEAHRRGLVHQDIKPASLFLPAGRLEDVRLLDFCLAHLDDDAARAAGGGTPIGISGYIAPEQARGERDVSPRADVFSLGCVLFTCLTGRRPFEADDLTALLLKLVLEDAPRLRAEKADAPAALDELLARMLSKSPLARPEDGAEVARALSTIDRGSAGAVEAARVPQALTTTERPVLLRGARLADGGRRRGLGRGRDNPADADRAALAQAVEAHNGQLSVLADHSLLITVPNSGVFTDQAARAARSALAVLSRCPEARVAVAAGRGDLSAPMPIGRVIDRGVDLLRVTPPAVIRVDEVIAGLIVGGFELSGDSQSLRLLSERRTMGQRTLLGQPTPFVGRERELNLLEALFDEVLSEQVARTVAISAPAGVGKSRLRIEFFRRVRERQVAGLEIWLARSDPMRTGSPFGLVAPIIREIAGVLEGEPLEVRRHKLLARIGRHLPDGDRTRVALFLGELAGVPFPEGSSVELTAARSDAMLMGDQARRALTDFIAAEVREGPADHRSRRHPVGRSRLAPVHRRAPPRAPRPPADGARAPIVPRPPIDFQGSSPSAR